MGFFHAQTRERARVKKIKALQLDEGRAIMAQLELEAAANVFHQSLFTSQLDIHSEDITVFVEPKVNEVMNEKLCAPITYRS